MLVPHHCRPEAFKCFLEHLPQLETTDGLLQAAVSMSMHAFEDLRLDQIQARLDALAARVRSRVRSRRVDVMLAHLHEVLFVEEGFRGNRDSYYHPLNSHLPAVLETKLGLPVTLTLIYKVVAERVGIPVQGINCLAHFLARVEGPTGSLLIDPFYEGQMLSPEEAFSRIEQALFRPLTEHERVLPVATHREWLGRIIGNLGRSLARNGSDHDCAAMMELLAVLQRQ